MKRSIYILAAAVVALWAGTSAASAQTAEDMVAKAKNEGVLVIYGTNGIPQVKAHFEAFKKVYPEIKIEYTEISSGPLYTRVSSEIAAGGQTADVVMSASSELMMKTAKDGNALVYDSPALAKVPAYDGYQKMVFELETEPMCNLYNTNSVKETDLPKTKADFIRMLSNPASPVNGKVTMYDIELSGVGFSALFRDSKKDPGFWSFAEAIGKARTTFISGGYAMAEKVGSGEMSIAYNIPCQVLSALKGNPNIGFFFFNDYVLMTGQYALITKSAAHPNAAKIFVDWLMSQDGQQIYGQMPGIYPVMPGVKNLDTTGLQAKGVSTEGPVLDEGLLQVLDPVIRPEFIKKWKDAVAKGRAG
jgi:iron(III) transport system substrate-binding protein